MASIAVAGKGGTGKTTLAALIVLALREAGKGPVLAIDADPDANLGTVIGLEPPQTVGELREDVLKEFKSFPAGMSKAQYVQAGLHEIIAESEGLDLITMGRGEGAGCYCYLNSLIRKFSDDLMPEYPWTVIDNEAGLEHISRRTSTNIDYLLVVVNTNPISIRTAESVLALAKSIPNPIRHLYTVTNMLTDAQQEAVRERLAGLPAEHLGNIPRDDTLEQAIFEGRGLAEVPDGPAMAAVKRILEKTGGF